MATIEAPLDTTDNNDVAMDVRDDNEVVVTGEEGTVSEVAQGVDYKEWNGIDIIPSLCMSCGATGETRLMLHKIPYFRELVIASFHCEECGERNNEVTFGG
jgi:zinc finger protein